MDAPGSSQLEMLILSLDPNCKLKYEHFCLFIGFLMRVQRHACHFLFQEYHTSYPSSFQPSGASPWQVNCNVLPFSSVKVGLLLSLGIMSGGFKASPMVTKHTKLPKFCCKRFEMKYQKASESNPSFQMFNNKYIFPTCMQVIIRFEVLSITQKCSHFQ